MDSQEYIEVSTVSINVNIEEIDEQDLREREKLARAICREYDRLGTPRLTMAFDGFSRAELIERLALLKNTPTPATASQTAWTPESDKKIGKSSKTRPKGQAIKTGQGYFVKTPIDAIMDTRLSHSDLRLLQLLMILAGQKGYCWHAESKLAEMMIGPQRHDDETAKHKQTGAKQGVSRSTIEKGIAKLARNGYVEIIRPDDLKSCGYDHHTSGNTYVVNPYGKHP